MSTARRGEHSTARGPPWAGATENLTLRVIHLHTLLGSMGPGPLTPVSQFHPHHPCTPRGIQPPAPPLRSTVTFGPSSHNDFSSISLLSLKGGLQKQACHALLSLLLSPIFLHVWSGCRAGHIDTGRPHPAGGRHWRSQPCSPLTAPTKCTSAAFLLPPLPTEKVTPSQGTSALGPGFLFSPQSRHNCPRAEVLSDTDAHWSERTLPRHRARKSAPGPGPRQHRLCYTE